MNRVTLCGNLGKDPELRRTQSGTAVASFTVATTERRKDGEHTEWHNIVVWDKLAENCGKFLKKGRKVLLEGRLQTREWEKDGHKRHTTEIVANTVEFLSPAEGPKPSPEPKPQEDDPFGVGDEIPF
jgi:single-strand DNA-binding protein